MTEKPNWTNKMEALSALAIVLTSLWGLYLVVGELRQLTRQNEVLEQSLRQTYKPIATLTYSIDKPELIILGFTQSASPDKFSFVAYPKMVNAGSGLLSLLGYCSILTKSEVSFRDSLMAGRVSTVYVDSLASYVRRTPVMKDKMFDGISISCPNIEFQQQYFLQTIVFYEDMDGNLYDTEHMDLLLFEKPFPKDDRLVTRLNKDQGGWLKERYHFYTPSERKVLAKRLKELKHPVWELIASD